MSEGIMKHASENAKGWVASIEEMLENLYGYETAAKAEGWTGPFKDEYGATYFGNDSEKPCTWPCDSWQELCDAFDIDAERSESAEQAIHESILSVMVRDGWRDPSQTAEGAEEYELLLSTGGPALRIIGQLNEHGEPTSAELQIQDWNTPWTRYAAPESTLLSFAQCFYFGE